MFSYLSSGFGFFGFFFFKGSGVTKFVCDHHCPWQLISDGALTRIRLFQFVAWFSNQLTDRGVLAASMRSDGVGITCIFASALVDGLD